MPVPLVKHRGAERGAEDLVGGEVEERLEIAPVADEPAGVFEQRDGRLDIIADEGDRVGDRVVDVGLRSHVHDKLDVVAELVRDTLRDGLHEVGGEHLHAVEDAGVPEAIVSQRRVGELVDDDQVTVGGLGEVLHDVVPDEPASAGDDDLLPGDAAGNRDGGGELLDGRGDVLAILGGDPPADGDGDQSGLHLVEEGQVGAVGRAHAVGIVPGVHLRGDDVLALHERDEIVLVLHVEGVDPVGGQAAFGGLEEGHAVQALESLVVEFRVPAVTREDAVEVGQVGEAEGGGEVVHVHLEAVLGHIRLEPEILTLVVALIAVDAVPPEELAPVVKGFAREGDDATVTGGEVLDGLGAEHADVSRLERADPAALPLSSDGVSGILDHHGPEPEPLVGELDDLLDAVQIDGGASPVHELDHLGVGRELVLEVLEVDVRVLRIDVHPLGLEPVGHDGPVGGGAGERGGEDLITGLETRPRARGGLEHVQREVQAARGGVERQRVWVLEELAELLLELLDLGALGDVAARERGGRLLGGIGSDKHLEEGHLGTRRHGRRRRTAQPANDRDLCGCRAGSFSFDHTINGQQPFSVPSVWNSV